MKADTALVASPSTNKSNVAFLREVFTTPPDAPGVLVKGLIRKGESIVIGAPRGAFKSWLAMDMALHLASGDGAVFGEFSVEKPSRVLLLHGEFDPWSAYMRWVKLCGSTSPPSGLAETFEPYRLRVVKRRMTESYRDDTGSRLESHERREGRVDQGLIDIIDEHGFDVLIADPFASFFVGEEPSNDEVEAGLSALSGFARERELTVILTHHFSMSGKGRDPEDSWRGASRLPDWASLRITLDPYYTPAQAKKQGLSRSQARQYAIARFLARRDETPLDLPIKFDLITGRWEKWREAHGFSSAFENELSPEQVADTCRRTGGNWPSIRQAAEDLGVSQATAKKVLDKAERAGKLVGFDGPRRAKGYRVPTSWDPAGDTS